MEAHSLALVTAGQVYPWEQPALHQLAQFRFPNAEIGCGFIQPEEGGDLGAHHRQRSIRV